MNRRSQLLPWVGDMLPALVVTGLAAVAMSRKVPELDGKLAILTGAGLVGIALGRVAVWGLARGAVAPVPAPAPVAPQTPPLVAPAAPRATPLATGYAPSTSTGYEAFSLPKMGSSDDENEDSWATDEARGLIAVSDGASSSFGARVWSSALVDAVASDAGAFHPDVVPRAVERAATVWTEHHTQGEVAWWAQEGLRRGAFATLLAVSISSENSRTRWRALAVGDSCLLHLRRNDDGWSLLRSFPLESAAAFGSHPDLLSSVNMPPAEPTLAAGDLASGDVLIAATDAVSEWLLGDDERVAFAAEAPLDLISDTVVQARVDRSMVNDDATFVRYREP